MERAPSVNGAAPLLVQKAVMNVAQIRLTNFRNHESSDILFGSGFNVLLGSNGQGKTNVLEAISYLSLTKSFYAANDSTTLQIGKEFFEINGTLLTQEKIENRVCVTYQRETGEKQFSINRSRPETLGSVIGRFPIVILSPENNAITFGAPLERRKFLDLILSQVSRVYFDDLLEYRRALKQRNKILTDLRIHQRGGEDLLDPWTAELINYGSRIIHRRRQFVNEFETYVKRAYFDVVQDHEEPRADYVGLPEIPDDAAGIAVVLEKAFDERRREEIRRGATLVGPHRDELRFSINGNSVQKYASQGQHKTLLVALKVAEFFYLKERNEEVPILLLDDVFSELDEHRSKHILEMIGSLGQTFITSTSEAVFQHFITWDGKNRRFYVENGTCRQG